MAYLEIERAGPLSGTVEIQGSKNAALPMIAAALLGRGKTVIRHIPDILDVRYMLQLLELSGCRVEKDNDSVIIDTGDVEIHELPDEVMKKMRCSIILLAPLLYRCNKLSVHEPGGCSIGKRPIDFHLQVLQQLGTSVMIEGSRIFASCSGFRASEICLPFSSVGATEQALLACAAADGISWIRNAAREPEIMELCRMLNGMGAEISGIGTSDLRVRGTGELHPVEISVCGDRIVAATYIAAVAVCKGSICLTNIDFTHLAGTAEAFFQTGCRLFPDERQVHVECRGRCRNIPHIATGAYPGFPTDVQSLLMSVLAVADGTSRIEERIFEERFRTAEELRKMNADIIVSGHEAEIRGVECLQAAAVCAPDLRGGAALAVAALGADGVTRLDGLEHILRGYEDLPGDLRKLGANVWKREEAENGNFPGNQGAAG